MLDLFERPALHEQSVVLGQHAVFVQLEWLLLFAVLVQSGLLVLPGGFALSVMFVDSAGPVLPAKFALPVMFVQSAVLGYLGLLG